MFARQHHFGIKLVDCGVNADFGPMEGLIDRKIRKGTSNYLYEAAMTPEEFDRAFEIGVEIVDMVHDERGEFRGNGNSQYFFFFHVDDLPNGDSVE